MNFNLHLHPGPRDDSLLYLGAEHRSRKLFLNPQEGDMCTIDFKRGDAAFWEPVINEIITFPSNVLKYIDLFGFGGVLRCTYRRLDRALIEALIERWRPETNTFHMPFGEVTVTLEDVNVLWGLPVEGIALSWHEESFSNDQRVQMCHTYLGLYTDRKNFKSHMLKLSTLIEFMKDYPVTDDSTDEECIQRAHCICLILATKTVLPDTNNAHVPLHLLTHLTDFNISGQMSWGAASLACLYRELYKGTMPDTSAIGGPMALLQIWAWTRIRSMAPTIVDPIIDWNSPYGSRWADHDLNTTETPTHVIKAQRQTLQKLQKDDFDWMPYRHVMRRLPPMCRTGIYGTWDENFHELPSYIMVLQQANPGTVVQWLHHPNSPSDYSVFKYVFWAFKPSIEAFTYCIPVISIDATHLRGTYKGKILMAVSKNANNMILPIAYALVDEETNQSWKWFLQMFAENVEDPSRRTLCVISDRHLGIKHAMENLQSWKHPNAYHRYCLRHVRSNFMAKFKNVSLKRMCWEIGSTTQQRKYERLMDALKVTNKQAWQYLNGIDKTKWTRLFDNNNRRWGILTTNISESMNNVLRGARMLPIRALIEYTFKREVEQYAIHYTTADNCSTEFPPRMWTLFHTREIRARQHRVYPYSARHQRFMVETPLQTSDESGHSPYTVEFEKKTCSCGKWQIFRFPCSHAIAVCHHLRKNPSTISDQRFLTPTYRAQYNNQYFPVAHKEDWWYAGWRIIADSSKITIVRGRRRARRMHNEMDATYAEERTGRRCSGCKNVGHRINACPYRQN